MDQNGGPGGTPFSLYLKAYNNIYSIVQINTLPTITTAVSVAIALVCGVAADRTGGFWILSVAVTLPVLVGMALLVAWDVGESGRLAGFFLTGFEGGKNFLLSSTSPTLATKIGIVLTLHCSNITVDNELGNRDHGWRRRGARSGYSQYECTRTSHCGWHAGRSVSSERRSELPRWFQKRTYNNPGAVFEHFPYLFLVQQG